MRTPRSSEAQCLLAALRAAGSHVWIDAEGDLLCSPPLQRVTWDSDAQEAIEELYEQLKALVHDERVTVH